MGRLKGAPKRACWRWLAARLAASMTTPCTTGRTGRGQRGVERRRVIRGQMERSVRHYSCMILI
jgi:hypothetical protein